MNALLHLLAYATAISGTTLDFHYNAGWCNGPNTPDDCDVADVACPSGEDAAAAADCWAICAAKYPNLVSVDIDEHDAGTGMCDCCCQTECDCLEGIGWESVAVQAGTALPGPCGPSWLACTDKERTCTMSETNYMSRGTDCHDYMTASEGSWESCSADCLADPYCIGLQRGDVDPGEDKWDHCEMIFDDSFEDCPDGEFTFYPKDCQCPLGSDAAAARGPLLVVSIGAVAAALAH